LFDFPYKIIPYNRSRPLMKSREPGKYSKITIYILLPVLLRVYLSCLKIQRLFGASTIGHSLQKKAENIVATLLFIP
jgi:hypothetical protein